MRGGSFVASMAAARDAAGFTRLRRECERDRHVSAEVTTHVLHRGAVILGAKGCLLADVTVGDVLQLLEVEAVAHVSVMAHGPVFYRLLHQLGVLGADAPATLREAQAAGQRSPEELIDQYQLTCRPVRDLLVDYLKERQPALDYTSLRSLAYDLAMGFWKDIERHHPGADNLQRDCQPRPSPSWWMCASRAPRKATSSSTKVTGK